MLKKSLRKCDSAATLNEEVESIRTAISQPETEESWDAIASALIAMTYLCENGASDYPSQLVAAAKSLYRPINSSMTSERSKLSGSAIELVSALATALESAFEPLLNLFFPTLLVLCTRQNKVFLSRARTCIIVIIECTQLPALFAHLIPALQDKSVSLRLAAVESLLTCLNCFNPPELEKEQRARDIENIIRATARDANPDVRNTSKKIFEAYKVLLPNRVDHFTEPLSPVMKKYLGIKQKQPSISSRPKTAFPSLPDLKAKAKLSASTSVLPPTTSNHTSSTTSDHAPTHMRSASAASVLPSAPTTKDGDLAAIIRPERSRPPSRPRSAMEKEPTTTKVPGSMPPPDYIPMRPNPSKRPTPAVRVPLNPDDPRIRTANTTSSSSQPMRVMLPAGAVVGAARRVPQTSQVATSTATATTGPRRPNRPMTIPTMMTADGLMRPILPQRSAGAESAVPPPEMTVMARRVPMPEPGSDADVKRGRLVSARQELVPGRDGGARRAPAATGPSKTAAPAKTERTRTMSKPAVVAGQERANSVKPHIVGVPSASGAAPKGHANAEVRNTQTTARGRTATESKAAAESSKPGWGRPAAPRKVAPIGKEKKDKEREQEQAKKEKGTETAPGRQRSRSRPQQQQNLKVKPESVPLPPSPGRSIPKAEPVEVSLPPSPIQKVELEVANDEISNEPMVLDNKPDTEPTSIEFVTNDSPDLDSKTTTDDKLTPPSQTEEAQETPEDPISSPVVDTAVIPQTPTTQPLTDSDTIHPGPHPPTTPTRAQQKPLGHFLSIANTNTTNASTPISSLFESIQRGFLMTPSSPLSPPQTYIARAAAAAGLAPGVPLKFTTPPLMRDTDGLQLGLKPVIPIGLGVVSSGGALGGEEGEARVVLTEVGVNQ